MQTKIKSSYSNQGSMIQICDLYHFDLRVNPSCLQYFPPMQLSSRIGDHTVALSCKDIFLISLIPFYSSVKRE